MEDELENQDALNPEGEQDTTLENESIGEELAKAQEVAENQKIRAEKAEREVKDLKAKAEKSTPKNDDTQSNEPDYAKLAWLNSNKVEHPDDQKIVMDEAKRLKLPLTDVLAMKHIKNALGDAKDQREAESGSPKGKGKSGGVNQQDVDYHLAKGTTPADVELAAKVIDARMKKESNAGKFSEELFTG